ncbi:MAG: hypothetical protein GY769_08170 [bacterium]|nr:hypothetical protein [bacterium]
MSNCRVCNEETKDMPLCSDCFERELLKLPGVTMEETDGEKVFRGISLKGPRPTGQPLTGADLALGLKRRELEAMTGADLANRYLIDWQYNYFCGKAAAFSEAWELAAYGPGSLGPENYNAANELWCKKVREEDGE